MQPEIFIGDHGKSTISRDRACIRRAIAITQIVLISICVVAQARRLVELEHIDAAIPGAVAHPEVAVFVIRHGGIDGIEAIRHLPVASHIIFFCNNGCLGKYFCVIRRGIIFIVEPGIDHFAHIRPGAVQVVRNQQYDDGIVVCTVHREVHTPLAHRLVPDDVGRPAIFMQ